VTWKRTLLFLTLLAVAALSYPWKKGVADEWLPIDPADLKMTSEPKAPGAPAIYLYRQVDRKDLGHANSEYNYIRIKILTDEGRKYANVEIPYTKSVAGISNIRARTIHPDGSVANFDGKVYENTITKSKTQKYLAKTFSVPDVQVGSIVEYHYTYDFKDGYVYGSYWVVGEDLFTKSAKFSLVPYNRFPLHWDWPAGLPAGTDPPKQGPDGIIRMNSVDVPPFHVEDDMPPEHELRFRVDFVYNSEAFEENPDRFWKKFGKKQFDETDKFTDKRKAMEQAVAQIISPSDSADAKLRKIYARCQQLTNLDFVPSTEWVKYDKQKENNVEDVWKNGVGFGRNINLLFLALIRAAGFEAYYVRLAGRSEYFFNKSRMNEEELNADAVLVKSAGQDLVLDPATKFAPYGLLPWQETGVTGLRIDKDGGTWIQTLVPESADCKVIRQGDFKLDDDGTLEGTATITYTGLEALRLRLSAIFADDTEKKSDLEEGLKDTIPVVSEVELTNKPDWQGADYKFVAQYHVKVPGWASSAGKRALVPLGVFSGQQRRAFEHADRTYPIYFAFMYQTEDQTKINIPPGWKIDSLPKETHLDAKAVEYRISVAAKDNSLEVDRTFRSEVLLLPVVHYSNLRNIYQQIRTGDETQAVLLPGANSAAN
jgi:transglutaminase-like putative cysteine protease